MTPPSKKGKKHSHQYDRCKFGHKLNEFGVCPQAVIREKMIGICKCGKVKP